MIGPISRILLRYTAAALVTFGMLTPDVGAQIAVDPDLVAIVGVGIGALVEVGYALAKARGWKT